MKFNKLFYVVLSSILVTLIILITNVFTPFNISGVESSHVTKIYFADHISSALSKVIDRFNEINKGQIKVEPINLPFTKFSTNERKELLARYLRSKSDRIDVFSVDQIWVPRFAKWGLNLDGYFTEKQKSHLLKYSMQSCYYDDSLVAIPLYIDIALMYYRKDIINKLPNSKKLVEKIQNSITWQDFIKLSKEINSKNNPFYLYQADDFEGLICSFAEMTADQNMPFIRNDSLKLQTPQAEKSLQLLVDLVQKYHISPKEVTNFKEDQSYDYFLKHKGIFLRGWPSFLENHKKDSTYDQLINKIGIAPTPHFKGFPPRSVYGGWNLMVSQFSDHIPESIKFINFLISKEAQKILYNEGGYLPINSTLYSDTSFVNSHPNIKFYEHLLRHGLHRPYLEKYTSISDVLSFFLNKAIRNDISVKDALKDAAEKINSGSILLK